MSPRGAGHALHPVEVSSTVLPGIGVRQDVELTSGRRLGVVTRRSGIRDLVFYKRDDPDTAAGQIELTEQESNTLAELLGAPQLTFRLQVLQQQAAGLVVEQLPVPDSSPYAGRVLGDTQVRSRTGASIVAVLRQAAVIPSPAPDFQLHAGDLIVVVGTREAVDEVAQILDGSG
jgi:TrkA domain protein